MLAEVGNVLETRTPTKYQCYEAQVLWSENALRRDNLEKDPRQMGGQLFAMKDSVFAQDNRKILYSVTDGTRG